MSLHLKKLFSSYISSINLINQDELLKLQQLMTDYYINSPYHKKWIRGINVGWQVGVHNAQLKMCELIPSGSSILEVGCGDGSCAKEIVARVKDSFYTGIDLDENMWNKRKDFNFIAASADKLPFALNSFDVVLSMFVIEHLVFPNRHLDEAWRVLKPGGILITIAPDFDRNAMASERIGLSYGSGREKFIKRKFLDAFLTIYDSRIRLPLIRWQRRHKLVNGSFHFPIFTTPRCLELEEFIPDCDAIYPVATKEIENYMQTKEDYQSSELFYLDLHTFGLKVKKASKE